VAVHSSGEFGIQLATMLHLGAVLPNVTHAADARYHHLRDDAISGGKMPARLVSAGSERPVGGSRQGTAAHLKVMRSATSRA
jgi:hypothetical protein